MKLPNADAAEWDRRGYHAILDLISQEHAVVWPEVEAKLAERALPGLPNGINPIHLTNGRRMLLAETRIVEERGVTRGGRTIPVLGLADRPRGKTAFERAAAKKRLLQGRYLKWAEGSGKGANVIGEAGERVTHASLLAAMAAGAGYQTINPNTNTSTVERIFDAPVPGGSLDNAAHLVVSHDDGLGVVTMVVEVKNLRTWLYPAAPEIYQLLDKAAQLQLAWPKQRFFPLLVGRRFPYLTRVMAKHLGFFTTEFDSIFHAQPILRHWTVEDEPMKEVQAGLGYVFAVIEDQPLPRLTKAFQQWIPAQAWATAERWKLMAPDLAPHFTLLRQEHISGGDRHQATNDLYRDASRIVTPSPQWR